MSVNQIPSKQGLYNPTNERDACGVGFVAHIKGIKSHSIVAQDRQTVNIPVQPKRFGDQNVYLENWRINEIMQSPTNISISCDLHSQDFDKLKFIELQCLSYSRGKLTVTVVPFPFCPLTWISPPKTFTR